MTSYHDRLSHALELRVRVVDDPKWMAVATTENTPSLSFTDGSRSYFFRLPRRSLQISGNSPAPGFTVRKVEMAVLTKLGIDPFDLAELPEALRDVAFWDQFAAAALDLGEDPDREARFLADLRTRLRTGLHQAAAKELAASSESTGAVAR